MSPSSSGEMTVWQSVARYKRDAELAMKRGFRQRSWRRRCIGRPPRKWEVPIVAACGLGWMRNSHRLIEGLCAAI